MGLKLENGASSFTDVNEKAWYSGAIQTAFGYQLIRGFEDGTFRPNAKITREEAMAIIARAMAITELQDKLPGPNADITLSAYSDAATASQWAKSAIADSIAEGIVTGRSAAELAPKAYITRAEVAAIIQRLLQQSELI